MYLKMIFIFGKIQLKMNFILIWTINLMSGWCSYGVGTRWSDNCYICGSSPLCFYKYPIELTKYFLIDLRLTMGSFLLYFHGKMKGVPNLELKGNKDD
ncbi:hypothetical protein Q73_07850 [Bacillus coahuilensis m2-6]|nr:hypothetical protein Q73_07850 [Bacillus coahuilensis m2-6]